MVDALISDYMGRLEAASWPLPPSRRSELSAEVREHIESALTEAGSRDEATVRNVLDRLGRPEDIVAADAEAGPTAAGGSAATVPPAPDWLAQAAARGWGLLEIASVALLGVGALLTWWIGPIAGLVMAWFSRQWTQAEKRMVTLVVGGAALVNVVLLVVFMSRVSSFGMFGFGTSGFEGFGMLGLIAIVAGVLPLVAGLAGAIYLALAIQRRH